MNDITCILSWNGNQISAPISSLSDEKINNTWKLTSIGEEENLPISLIKQVCSNSQLGNQFIEKKLKHFANLNNLQHIMLIQLQSSNKPIGALYLLNKHCNYYENIFIRNKKSIEQIGRQISTVLEYNLLVSSIDNILERANKKTKQLEKLNDLKDQFVTCISDELCFPLKSILNLILKLNQTKTLSYEQQQLCKMIESSSNGLLVLINDIIDFQSCQNGNLQLKLSQFDLRTCLDECIQIVRENSITLNLITIDDIINHNFIIESDLARLKQVLVQLLSNALKFTEQGNVLLQVQILNRNEFKNIDHHHHHSLRLNNNNSSSTLPKFVDIQFDVIDTGIGISDSQQSKLFQAFSQLDCSSTRKYSGTGLGLALAQKIVQKLNLNSNITCKSTLGSGSTFSFTYKCPLINFSFIDPPIFKSNNNLNIQIYFYSKNEFTISALQSQSYQCEFPFYTLSKENRNDIELSSSVDKYNVIVVDFEYLSSFNFDFSLKFFDDFKSSCIFISLVHSNLMQYLENQDYHSTLFCPLTKFALSTAIKTAFTRKQK